MWLLTYLPAGLISFVVHSLVAIGLLGVIISFFVLNKLLSRIPAVANYYRAAQIGSVVVLALGVYLWGGYSMEMAYRERIAELEGQLEQARQESAQTNTQIETRVVTETQVIREKGKTQIAYIDRVVKGDTVEIIKDMSQAERDKFAAKQRELEEALRSCPVPQLVVEEHNKAAVREINRAAEGKK